MMKTISAAFCVAALTSTAALASGPDEFTLEPVGVTSTSTVVYSPETYTGGTTIQTDPVATTEGGFQNVDINDYLVPDTNTNSQ